MEWKETDERLIRRGELILDLESLKNHVKELENMNEGRPGPRYRLANSIIQLLAAIRYLYQMPYRQLEGYTRILHRLVPDLPRGDCARGWWADRRMHWVHGGEACPGGYG